MLCRVAVSSSANARYRLVDPDGRPGRLFPGCPGFSRLLLADSDVAGDRWDAGSEVHGELETALVEAKGGELEAAPVEAELVQKVVAPDILAPHEGVGEPAL